MLLSSIPAKFTIPFANSAGAGFINSIPTSPSATPGLASLTTGFPTLTFQPEASGGQPPYGADFNGILKWITQWLQWAAAGGFPVRYDAAFQTAIGGYPLGAVLEAATFGNGRFWISTVDGNTTNPDSSGAGWMAFPDLAVQRQAPNFGNDTGTVNQVKVALFPVPTTWASIVGMPVRVGAVAAANSVNNPQIYINGLPPATMVNPDSSALGIGQISLGCTLVGTPRADGTFQVDSPPKLASASTFPYPGCTMLWPSETPPAGWLEMNGSLLLISSYANLFAVLGTRYGGDGLNNFALPDWRGQFVRGWDHGRGLDPNAATRANAGGGITGDHVGTTQTGAAGPISLNGAPVTIDDPQFWDINTPSNPGGSPAWYHMLSNIATHVPGEQPELPIWGPIPVGGANYYTVTKMQGNMTLTGNSGASETRPTNIYAMPIIKT